MIITRQLFDLPEIWSADARGLPSLCTGWSWLTLDPFFFAQLTDYSWGKTIQRGVYCSWHSTITTKQVVIYTRTKAHYLTRAQ